ncbi:hypothetical protein [Thermococcus profundus]|uniref:hypothetical protein n=1 Tax=Thermococcus profundus TaxID=49899 RepID=UPI0012FE02E3|nr:hypothetical protein [Thermococcus profundus]
MDASIIWLVAGIFALVSFALDFRAEENVSQKLVDLFLGLGFLAWYIGRDYAGAVFMLAAAILYYPQLKRKLIRWRHG